MEKRSNLLFNQDLASCGVWLNTQVFESLTVLYVDVFLKFSQNAPTIYLFYSSPRVEKRRVQVPIPAGISDGQTLRLSLGGNQVEINYP